METQTPNSQNKVDVFSYLSEKEKNRILRLLISADKKYDELKEELENLLAYFKELEIEFFYMAEENQRYQEAYDEINRAIQKMEELIYSIPSPPEIFNKALGDEE